LVNAKRPLCTPEGHFVPFAGHSSKSGVLGNGRSTQGLNSVGAGGSWDPTPLTRAPTPHTQAPTSYMQAPTPYF